MKIHLTKEEKKEKSKEIARLTLETVKEKVEKYGKLKITFDREDFKDELSTGMGFGFQDLKKEYRTVVTEVVKLDYKVKFYPTQTEKGFGVDFLIKK